MRTKEGSTKGETKRRFGLGTMVAGGALVLAACGGSTERSDAGTTTAEAEAVQVVFDHLGGNSSIIEVYPGVTTAERDKIANGTFNDGDVVTGLCRLRGRNVSSQAGEEARTSDMWVQIQGTPNLDQYATTVYIENPESVLRKLEDC